ncbi:hypothetical protein COP1_001126 [Malus domestica]
MGPLPLLLEEVVQDLPVVAVLLAEAVVTSMAAVASFFLVLKTRNTMLPPSDNLIMAFLVLLLLQPNLVVVSNAKYVVVTAILQSIVSIVSIWPMKDVFLLHVSKLMLLLHLLRHLPLPLAFKTGFLTLEPMHISPMI